jgi:hypothetical protein
MSWLGHWLLAMPQARLAVRSGGLRRPGGHGGRRCQVPRRHGSWQSPGVLAMPGTCRPWRL